MLDNAFSESSLRPLLALDVDEVLALHHGPHAEQLGYLPHRYQGPSPTGENVDGTVWLHPDHGPWVRELAELADVVWCTSWHQLASSWIAEQLGLPTGWPWVPDVVNGVRWGRSAKLPPLFQYAESRALAVLDNEFGGKDDGVAEYRTETGKPTLLIHVDPHQGLVRGDVEQAADWLRRHR